MPQGMQLLLRGTAAKRSSSLVPRGQLSGSYWLCERVLMRASASTIVGCAVVSRTAACSGRSTCTRTLISFFTGAESTLRHNGQLNTIKYCPQPWFGSRSRINFQCWDAFPDHTSNNGITCEPVTCSSLKYLAQSDSSNRFTRVWLIPIACQQKFKIYISSSFTEQDGRKGLPAGNKTRSNRTHTAEGKATQRNEQSEAKPKTRNPHTGRQTAPDHPCP
jgi:hypothetical protein